MRSYKLRRAGQGINLINEAFTTEGTEPLKVFNVKARIKIPKLGVGDLPNLAESLQIFTCLKSKPLELRFNEENDYPLNKTTINYFGIKINWKTLVQLAVDAAKSTPTK